MDSQAPLASLQAALRDLLAWFDHDGVPGVVVGGIAASLLGRPRLTADVDAVVTLEQKRWPEFLSSSEAFGFRPRVSDALAFAQQSRVLLLRHDASAINIDISFSALPFEVEMLARSVRVPIANLMVPLPAPEDLIIMKVVANRPRDWEDIAAVAQAQEGLDIERIRGWVRQFADVLEMPELLTRLEQVLQSRV